MWNWCQNFLFKAFKVKECTNEINNGTHKSTYLALPKYCQDLEFNNPNSSAILRRHKKTNFFMFSFVMVPLQPDSIIVAPLIGLDGTHLKHKYQGSHILCISENRHSPCCYSCRCKRLSVPSCLCRCRCRKWRELALVSPAPSKCHPSTWFLSPYRWQPCLSFW